MNPKDNPCVTRPPDFSGPPASVPTMKHAAFLGSGCLMLVISTSTGRSSNLWVRSILEGENRIPDWLVKILDDRVPGFLESEKKLTPKAAKDRPLASPPGRLD